MKKLLVSLTLVLTACGQLAFSQAATPGRIAFVTLEGQVATVAPDGSNLRVLTTGSQRFQFPAWSPDGSQLGVLGADAEGGFLAVFEDEENAAFRTSFTAAPASLPFIFTGHPTPKR